MPFYTTTLSPGDFLPLFQLMDDYCDTRDSTKSHESHGSSRAKSAPTPPQQPSFTPKFDVRESNDSYILDGELPGAQQENIEIEFTGPETMVVKGRVSRNYDVATTSPESTTTNDDDSSMSDVDDASSTKSNYHSPTVEDENDETSANATTTPSTTNNVATAKRISKPQPAAPTFKYWASERQIGNFQRTFTFPNRISQDGVRATLRNGVLSITVPKEILKQAKRIRIE